MELSRQEALKNFAPLFENQHALPHDIFDFKNEMRPEITKHIKKVIPLAKELMLSFLNDKVIDTVCCGEICSGLHHADTPIYIAFIMDTTLPDQTLLNIGTAIERRGFVFKIYQHRIKFRILKKDAPINANWSITHHCWNIEPEFRDFPFTLDQFLDIYPKVNKDFHEALDNLEKDADGYLTLESQKTIKKYFEDLKEKSCKARYESPEKEYSLEWSIWRALNLFKVPQHYLGLVDKAETHVLEGRRGGKNASKTV